MIDASDLRSDSVRCPREVRRRRVSSTPGVEALDRRELMTAITLPVVMLSATTLDSQSVTFSYEVNDPNKAPTFGVFRSASTQFDGTAIPVATPLAAPSLDASGQPSNAPGFHQVTIPLSGGLPINPKHPFVLVVANPGSPSAIEPGETAAFHKVVIGVITHGGIQNQSWKKNGPPWERQMAQSLRDQGYDQVIAYNWVAQSNHPGTAVKQGPVLAEEVLAAAGQVPANDPVDIHFIGHSEGAVVNTQAIVAVEAQATPQIKAGFLEDTLLDPHAANPDFPGQQYSVGGPLGWVAKIEIDSFQAKARDPLAFIPAGVDASQVFYQQTPANKAGAANSGIYNLWGQVPVKGATTYYNLTADGITHAGEDGVFTWYQDHVVPSLGNGGQPIARDLLTGSLDAPTTPGGSAVDGSQASYSGTSAPGSTVTLFAGKAGSTHLLAVAQALTGADGTWTATTTPLAIGNYRIVAEARIPKAYPGDQPPVPTSPLGLLVIAAGTRS